MHQFNKLRGTKGFIVAWERVIRFRYMITDEAKRRTRILAFWEEYGDGATKKAFNVSRPTLFRWQQALAEGHGKLEALNKKSTAPRTRRKRTIPSPVEAFIVEERSHSPRLSKDKLAAMMQAEGVASLSASTVGRMLSDLKKQNKLPSHTKFSYYAKTGRFREKVTVRRKKLRRPKGYRALEADTVVRFIDGMKRYILTAVDTESRMAFACAYTNHGSASAADFLRNTRRLLPHCPRDVQTDNGSEFALHFHAAVKETGLHFNTHPRSPKENAHIERFNRSVSEEFLVRHRALLRDDVAAFNRRLVDWLVWYNTRRPHWSLGLVSPLRYIVSQLPVRESQMLWTDTKI
jgi:transposase InsO family protein